MFLTETLQFTSFSFICQDSIKPVKDLTRFILQKSALVKRKTENGKFRECFHFPFSIIRFPFHLSFGAGNCRIAEFLL
jgi:hypothetical protein